jgi:hypothetical protein
MYAAVANYFQTLVERFGQGWNRFWFEPSDPTTLCGLRIATGLVATSTLASYSFDLLRFFGPSGMLPTRVVRELEPMWRFSYLDYAYDQNVLWAAHGIGLAILVLFTLGFWSRLTSVLSLVVMLSYYHRAPMITSQFDRILIFVMFYLCLGPTGACFSLDRWLSKRKEPASPSGSKSDVAKSSAATAAIRLLQVHVAAVYAMMAAGKLAGQPVWWDGTAAWWLTRNLQSTLVDLTWLDNYPKWVNFLTHTIVVYQLGFPVLIWNRLARPLVLAIGALVWTLIAVLTGLVGFSLMMCVASLAFVESRRSE